MGQLSTRRKIVRNFHEPGHTHELTFSCYAAAGERHLAGRPAPCLGRAIANHGFRLIGFVFMPEHVHLPVLPRAEGSRIEGLLRSDQEAILIPDQAALGVRGQPPHGQADRA